MSSTAVLALTIGDLPKDLRELRNSHGSAPVIWDAMCTKYLGIKSGMWIVSTDRLWPLYKDGKIPKHQRAVLMMTYDRAYVRRQHYQRAADDIRQFLEDFEVAPNRVNHWPEIRTIFEVKPDCEAIGLYCTSIAENPFLGEFDDESEEYLPIDWETAFEIYDELDSLESD